MGSMRRLRAMPQSYKVQQRSQRVASGPLRGRWCWGIGTSRFGLLNVLERQLSPRELLQRYRVSS